MFVLSLLAGGLLGFWWYFRMLPDPIIYLLCLPVFLMAFTSGQRKFMFWRAGAKCENCGDSWESGVMLEAHHKKPLHEGGANHTDNGEMLCRPCHADAHEDLAYEAKKRGDSRAESANKYSARQIRKRRKCRDGY